MNKVNFNVNEFPKLCKEFYAQGYNDWRLFLSDLGYKFTWDHYANKRKYVELDEDEYSLFLLRWV